MLKFYYTPLSINARRVWVMLLEKHLTFEPVVMPLNGEQMQPEFLALNPFHHIPVLVDDNFTIVESLAILDYLEAQYPQPAFLPTEARAITQVRMLQLLTVNEFAPPLFPLMLAAYNLYDGDPQKLEQSTQRVQTALQFFEHQSQGSYLVGESLTLADIVVGTAIPLLFRISLSLEGYPQLQRWFQMLMERQSWQQTELTEEAIALFKTKLQNQYAFS
jgi:glutathione S-transferase